MDIENNWKADIPEVVADVESEIYPEDTAEYSEHLHGLRESAREHLDGIEVEDDFGGSIRSQASNVGLPGGSGGR
jgi:hypothetical protein